MTRIRTDYDEIHELQLLTSGSVDYLFEVIANSTGELNTEDTEFDFDMTTEDYEWWKTWAHNEQLINDTLDERGLVFSTPNFYDMYPDYEDAQREYAKYLGVEILEFA